MKLLAMNQQLVLFCIVALLGLSCNKAGVGGKASISGAVMHHEVPITSATVYIKYGADAFPGFDLDQYDDQRTASATDASYSFTNLYKGDYYIYSTGYDTSRMEVVSGGVPVKIKKKKENIEIDIPVKE
jgi:hypothetical protein